MPEGVEESSRVQLCGAFAVELSGRRIDNMLPGRQGRLLFAYLALSRLRPVSRSTLVDALWGDDQPADIGGALNALISKTRAVVGGQVLRGRSELILALPEPASVDVEVALSMVHAAESAVAVGAWRRAWSQLATWRWPTLATASTRSMWSACRWGRSGHCRAPPSSEDFARPGGRVITISSPMGTLSAMADRRLLLLDTDIGNDIDDAVCLAYLLAQPRCELLGITTVTAAPDLRARLASVLCRNAGRDVPIYPGAADPLVGPPVQEPPPQAVVLDRWEHDTSFPTEPAVDFLRRAIRAHPGEVTLLTIGPLTNVALLFAADPAIPSLLDSVVSMGGSYGPGLRRWSGISTAIHLPRPRCSVRPRR